MRLRALSVWSIVFWVVLIFQVSVLQDVLRLGMLGRLANTLTLLIFFVCSLRTLTGRLPERVFAFYCFPILLVLLSYSINILRSGNLQALSHLGLLLPWLAALSVPFAGDFDWRRYWLLYYRFMLVVSIIALIEYAAVFYGYLTPELVETRNGDFLKGVFTIFFGLDDEVVHNRMYGMFPEPGTFAMLLIPALVYAFVHRKAIPAIVFLACVGFTASLGGYIGVAITLLFYALWLARKKGTAASLAIVLGVVIAVALTAGTLYEYFSVTYEGRGESALTRQSNVLLFFRNFSDILFRAPLGMELRGESLSTLADTDPLYIGSNFSIGTSLIVGGGAAFFGYTMFLVVNTLCWLRGMLRGSHDGATACVYLSYPALLTFVFQRTPVFDLAVYSFLFAAPLLAMLHRDPVRPTTDLLAMTRPTHTASRGAASG